MEKKSRKTKQKEVLYEEIKKVTSFFTAEELFKKVNKKEIGLATIYRFLGDLVQKREISSYVCERKTIYSRDKKSHCHFICEKCGGKSHIEINSLDFIKKKIEGSICHFQIDIYGFCITCK